MTLHKKDRWRVKMYFLEWEYFFVEENQNVFFSKRAADNVSALVQVIASCRLGNKPLSVSMMTKIPAPYIFASS